MDMALKFLRPKCWRDHPGVAGMSGELALSPALAWALGGGATGVGAGRPQLGPDRLL